VLPNWEGCGDTSRIEKLRMAIADAPFVTEAGELSVTCSFGVTWSEQGCFDPQELVRRADRALYRAKALGRNRVESVSAQGSSQPVAPDHPVSIMQ